MGLKHLTRIQNIMSSGEWFNRTYIRDSLRIDFNTVEECLAYLVREGWAEIKRGDVLWYRKKKK